MPKFHAIVTTQEGKSFVYDKDLPEIRFLAEKAAREYCKLNGYTLENVCPDKRTIKQPSTMQKDWKERFARNRNRSF